MKRLSSFLTTVLLMIGLAYGQSISNLPAGTYNNVSFTNIQKDNIEYLSSSFRGLLKVNAIYPTFCTYGPNHWPLGAWGRGYQTWYGWTASTFWSNQGVFYAHHPLTRDCSAFLRGHLHLYLSGHTGNNLSIIQAGIDYLLAEQIASGPNMGGYIWWNKRDSQTSINMTSDVDEEKNYPEVYEVGYALAALSEYYLSEIPYRRDEVKIAILKSAQYIANLDWANHTPGIDNANVRGLALWGLSTAYKATGECGIMYEIKILANWFIDEQEPNGLQQGEWLTGGLDPDMDPICESYYHDTKISYHFFIIRGLVEAFDVIPDQDSEFKTELVTCLKRAINHVIDKRIQNSSPTAPNLYDLYLNFCGIDIRAASGGAYRPMDLECWVDAMAKLTYYSRNSVHFTPTERTNIKNLTNKLASGLDPNEKWHLCAIGSYLHYMNAVNNGTTVNLNWNDPNMHYTPDMITGRVVSGDFDNDGELDDMAAFYDYGVIAGNSKTALHVWGGETDHFNGPYTDGWWLSTSFTANQITGKVVSGDFDHDNFKDDIAAFYDVDGNQTAMYVWISNGSSFTIQQWWYGSSYSASQITDKVVSGDFDRDGWWDDIAAFYEVGPLNTRLHVFCSNTNSFTSYDGWWSNTNYASSKIAGRVVSGDFDNDNKNDDIAAFYDNGSGNGSIDFWTSNGGGVYTKTTYWGPTAYDVTKISKRVVSGDFDNDNRVNDIAAFYKYDATTTRVHVWKMDNSISITYFSSGWWNSVGYYTDMLTGRVVSGNFNNDPSDISDIGIFHKYGSDNMRVQVLTSNGSSFTMPTSSSWWLPCWWYPALSEAYEGDHQTMVDASVASEIVLSDEKTELVIYPNPSSGVFYVDRTNPLFIQLEELHVFDSQGKLVFNTTTQFEQFIIPHKGIYYVMIKVKDGRLFNSKVIVI